MLFGWLTFCRTKPCNFFWACKLHRNSPSQLLRLIAAKQGRTSFRIRCRGLVDTFVRILPPLGQLRRGCFLFYTLGLSGLRRKGGQGCRSGAGVGITSEWRAPMICGHLKSPKALNPLFCDPILTKWIYEKNNLGSSGFIDTQEVQSQRVGSDDSISRPLSSRHSSSGVLWRNMETKPFVTWSLFSIKRMRPTKQHAMR